MEKLKERIRYSRDKSEDQCFVEFCEYLLGYLDGHDDAGMEMSVRVMPSREPEDIEDDIEGDRRERTRKVYQ